MSDGARSSRIARAACPGSSERTSSRARSSAPASGRSGAGPSSGETAGSAPRKHGVVETTMPSATRLFSDMWWPPNRQPHGAGAAGLAEHPQVVQARVAAPFAAPVDGPALDVVEHVVQPDDGGDGDVPGGGQPGGDELVSQLLLGRPLGAEGQPAVVGGRVEPAPALGVGLGVRAGRATGGHRTLRRGRARRARRPRRRPSGRRPPGPRRPAPLPPRSYSSGLLARPA